MNIIINSKYASVYASSAQLCLGGSEQETSDINCKATEVLILQVVKRVIGHQQAVGCG